MKENKGDVRKGYRIKVEIEKPRNQGTGNQTLQARYPGSVGHSKIPKVATFKKKIDSGSFPSTTVPIFLI